MGEILQILGIRAIATGLDESSFSLPLREKMLQDKVEKTARVAITIFKVKMGVGIISSFIDRIRAFFFRPLLQRSSHKLEPPN